MNFGISFHSQGRADYIKLVKGYMSIRRELGEHVRAIFRQQAQRFAEWPDSGTCASRQYRYFTFKTFPYKVFYKKSATGIVIMTVCHSKRHPRAWKSFLRNA